MGYTKKQVITDVLDSYDAPHHVSHDEPGDRDAPGAMMDTDVPRPVEGHRSGVDPTNRHPTEPALVSDEIGTKENND